MTPHADPDKGRYAAGLSAISTISNIALMALCAFVLAPLLYIAYDETRDALMISGGANAYDALGLPTSGLILLPQPDKSVSVLFLGDMMFDRGVRTKILSAGAEAVFASTTRYLTSRYDIAVANLEGPITSNRSKTIDAAGKAIPGFTFTFPTSTAELLRDSGIDVVSLANNHADNFGPAGLRETFGWLEKSGVKFFGNANNDPAVSDISAIQCANEICIGLIGYHQFTEYGQDAVLSEIGAMAAKKQLGEVHAIIVFPHWGNEYQKIPSALQKSLAHAWIDAGADMVIGAHPHIIQSIELRNGRPILYSLGNYIFDQYFSYDTTHGMAVGLKLVMHDNGAHSISAIPGNANIPTVQLESISLIPIDITGTTVRIASDVDKARMLADLARISGNSMATSTVGQFRDQILSGAILLK